MSVASDKLLPKMVSQLSHIKPIYMLPDERFAQDVLIPCFENAVNVDCVSGYFSSEALVTIAPGLATFINHSEGTLRLIVSPFLSDKDRQAMQDGLLSSRAAAEQFLEEMLVTEDLIKRHTLRCFSWLLSAGRIEMKIGSWRVPYSTPNLGSSISQVPVMKLQCMVPQM